MGEKGGNQMRIIKACVGVSCLAVFGVAAGCSVTSSAPNDGGAPDGAGVGADAGGADGGTPDTGASDGAAGRDAAGDAAGDAQACNGSQIPAQITVSTTLTTACSPWHLTAATVVGDPSSPVLTIEAGVTILADKNSALLVGVASGGGAGGIQAVGTASAPIVFTSSAATPAAGDWGGVTLGAQVRGDAKLSHVTLDYAGGTSVGARPSSLRVGEGTNQAIVLPLSNIRVTHSLGYGILLAGAEVGFGAGSGGLTITDWGNGLSPIAMNANQASSLAGVSFSTGSSGHDGQVDLAADGNGNGGQTIVDHTQTWPVIPIPYLADNAGIEIEGAGSSHATLTIASPNTVMFTNQNPPTGIVVDPNASGQGDLVGDGVVFTSNSASPTPGSWGGIIFKMTGAGLPNSSLKGATFDWAGGGTASVGGKPCPGATGVVWIDNSAATSNVSGPIITGSTFENYASTVAIVITSNTGYMLTNDASYQSNTFTSAAKGVCGS